MVYAAMHNCVHGVCTVTVGCVNVTLLCVVHPQQGVTWLHSFSVLNTHCCVYVVVYIYEVGTFSSCGVLCMKVAPFGNLTFDIHKYACINVHYSLTYVMHCIYHVLVQMQCVETDHLLASLKYYAYALSMYTIIRI